MLNLTTTMRPWIGDVMTVEHVRVKAPSPALRQKYRKAVDD